MQGTRRFRRLRGPAKSDYQLAMTGLRIVAIAFFGCHSSTALSRWPSTALSSLLDVGRAPSTGSASMSDTPAERGTDSSLLLSGVDLLISPEERGES